MNSDQTSYKRATVVSLIGLGIQGVLTLTILLYALIGRDHAALSASLYLLLGLPVWFSLALVFHQHRLAVIEQAEEEILRAGSTAQTSVFQETAGELRVAARKLDWMHRILLPSTSVLVGGGLVILGWIRYSSGVGLLAPDAFIKPPLTGWAMAIGITVAAIGFVFARFVAGMAKQEIWANLRAGATWSVGAAVLGLLLAIAHGISFATSDALLRHMPVIVPIIMMALGAEVFLNFVLGIYRPRQEGEAPRPAFDSRILGFIAAPDRIAESISEAINYQFGLDLSSTWFYKLFSRSLVFLLLVGGLVMWLLSSVAVVGPDEKALVLRSGRLIRTLDSSVTGKLPWPFERVETYPAERLTEVQLGSPSHLETPGGPLLWTEDHGFDERFFIVRASKEGTATSAVGNDFALVSAEIPLQYVIENLVTYQWLAADSADPGDRDKNRRDLLRSVAQREAMEVLAAYSIDDILGADREAINQVLASHIRARFAQLNPDPATGAPRGAGVRIISVGVVGAHPPFPNEVGASFESVVNAEQKRLADLENAHKTVIETLASVAGEVAIARRIVDELDTLERLTSTGADQDAITRERMKIEGLIDKAGGEAAGLLLAARADRWTRHMEYKGRAVRQKGRLAMYRAAPEVYLAGLYLDALRDSVKKSRLFITTFHEPNVTLSFEQIESTLGDILNETHASQEK